MGNQWVFNANGDVVTPVEIYGSNVMQPMDIQSHLQTTIQVHNAVSVAATTGTSQSIWFDTQGYDQVGVTFMNDASTNAFIDVHWSHDGTTLQGFEQPMPTSTNRHRAANTPTKARYVRIVINNTDAAAHTMSAWIYLKA